MKNLSERWQKLILWLTGYLSIIAFVIAGGYIYQKSDNENLRNSAKTVLLITVVFTIIDIILLIVSSIVTMSPTANYAGYVVTASVCAIIKAVCFVTLCILDLCGISLKASKVQSGKPTESKLAEETQENKPEENK